MKLIAMIFFRVINSIQVLSACGSAGFYVFIGELKRKIAYFVGINELPA